MQDSKIHVHTYHLLHILVIKEATSYFNYGGNFVFLFKQTDGFPFQKNWDSVSRWTPLLRAAWWTLRLWGTRLLGPMKPRLTIWSKRFLCLEKSRYCLKTAQQWGKKVAASCCEQVHQQQKLVRVTELSTTFRMTRTQSRWRTHTGLNTDGNVICNSYLLTKFTKLDKMRSHFMVDIVDYWEQK